MAEQKVKVNGKDFDVVLESEFSGLVNGQPFEMDVQQISASIYHVIKDNRSFEVELLSDGQIKVNGTLYTTERIDRFDALLKQLGMDRGAAGKVSDIKAPMPGLVLKVIAKPGDEVKKGDAILVLEAMKMENSIKSPADGSIASIEVKQGETVEKGQVMVKFA